jgi:hypothetical protein
VKPIILIAIAVAGFILFSCLVLLVISRLGGWKKLSEDHPFDEDKAGKFVDRYNFCELRLNFIGHYRKSIAISIYDGGIRLRSLLFFSVFHKPIFIKWKDIKGVEHKKHKTVVYGADINMAFYGRSGEAVYRHYLDHSGTKA